MFCQDKAMLIVWDTQTGVVIGGAETQYHGKIIFHRDQRTITLIQQNQHFYIYDALNCMKSYQGEIPSLSNSGLGSCWAHNDTLQFATGFGANRELVIHELQLIPTPKLHTISSFPILLPSHIPSTQSLFGMQPQHTFSFSPISFHVSFFNEREIIVFDVQGSKLLLQTKVDGSYFLSPGKFSSDGQFFACRTSQQEICVWQNASTGYILQSSLRPRLLFKEFSWSSTSVSILCWGTGGIQLLHPDGCLNPPSSNKAKLHQPWNHLVTYSTDGTHIAVAWKGGSVVTVFDCLTCTPQQFTSTSIEIQDIKIVNNTVFAVDRRKLIAWDFRAGGAAYDTQGATRVVLNKALSIGPSIQQLTLSHDCSQLAFATHSRTLIFLHNIETQGGSYRFVDHRISDIQFSPSGHQLWFTGANDSYYFLEITECLCDGEITEGDLEDGQLLFNPPSLYGYNIRECSAWVMDSVGNKLLWLPPNWRTTSQSDVRWSGKFLALLQSHHPEPVVIEFKPSPHFPSSYLTHSSGI